MMRRLAALWLALLILAPCPAIPASLDFDGSTGVVTLANSRLLSGAPGLSASLWVNVDSATMRSYILFDAALTTFDFRLDTGIGGGGLAMLTRSNGGFVSTGSRPAVGVWQNVAFWWDPNLAVGQRARIYIDGVLQETNTDSTGVSLGTATGNMELGQTLTTTFNGRMYNIKVWARTLTQEQLIAEMRCYRPQETSSLALWLPLDSGDKLIPDHSPFYNNGTANAGVSVSSSTPPLEYCGGG